MLCIKNVSNELSAFESLVMLRILEWQNLNNLQMSNSAAWPNYSDSNNWEASRIWQTTICIFIHDHSA